MLSAELEKLQQDINKTVHWALCEDLGANDIQLPQAEQDITAMLIPADEKAVATVITREECIICGVAWVNAVFKQLDQSLKTSDDKKTRITWFVNDGESVKANTTLFTLEGSARTLLTGERAALNFLQTLAISIESVQIYTSSNNFDNKAL